MTKPYEHIDYFNPKKDDDDEVASVDSDDPVHSSSSLNGDESVSSGILSIEKKVNALEDLFKDLEGELGDNEEERQSELSYDTTTRDDVDKLRRELDDADRHHSLSWKNYFASLKKKNEKTELPSSMTETQEETIALKLGFENVTTPPEKLTWDDIIQRSSENSENDFADERSDGDKERTPLHAPCTRDEKTCELGSTRRFKSFVWILLLILAVICGTVLFIIHRRNDEPNSNQNDRLITEAPSPLGSATSTLKPSSTRAPTMASTTVQPSIPTSTMAPTESRATTSPSLLQVYRSAVIEFLQTEYGVDFQDPDSPTNKAVDWLMSEGPHEMDHKLAQRFTLAVLDFSLQSAVTSARTLNFPNFATPKVDECQWYGVYCNGEGWVRELSLNGQGLKGKIPSEIRILQGSLVSLDLSRNEISGSIPDDLFQLINLERLYVYQNQLTGGVSPKFSLLQDLTHLHASHNNLDGPLPNDFRRMTHLRYLNLYRNRLTGRLPRYMKYMSSLWYLDLGQNELSGDLPDEWGDGLESLRHLHLDHNNIDGYIPSVYTKLGSYQLQTLTLNDNKLVGGVPYEHSGNLQLELVTFNLNNNMLSKTLDKHLCELSIFESGQIVEFKADCNICGCSNMFCSACPQQ